MMAACPTWRRPSISAAPTDRFQVDVIAVSAFAEATKRSLARDASLTPCSAPSEPARGTGDARRVAGIVGADADKRSFTPARATFLSPPRITLAITST
jgi:hypothetical protein